jgi:hypothetical protein
MYDRDDHALLIFCSWTFTGANRSRWYMKVMLIVRDYITNCPGRYDLTSCRNNVSNMIVLLIGRPVKGLGPGVFFAVIGE